MTARLLLLLALASAGCPGGTSHEDAGAPDAPLLPDCPDPGSLYGFDQTGTLVPLTPLAPLAVVIGFQGFQMARVVLHTAAPLVTDLASGWFAEVDGLARIEGQQREVASHPIPGGYASDEFLLLINDVPLAELVGRQAVIGLRAYTADCILRPQLQVTLVAGPPLGADAGVE